MLSAVQPRMMSRSGGRRRRFSYFSYISSYSQLIPSVGVISARRRRTPPPRRRARFSSYLSLGQCSDIPMKERLAPA